VPQIVTSCSNTNFCIQSSFISTLSSFNDQVGSFGSQLAEARAAAKSKSIKKKIDALIVKLNALNATSFSILGALPTGNSSCS
jgi:hypothetical protein